MLYPILPLDVVAMEKVHQLSCCDFVCKGQKVDIDFIDNILVNQQQFVPVAKQIKWKDFVGKKGLVKLRETLCTILPSTHSDRSLTRRCTPLIVSL
jgi:hypothetical protein